MSHLERTDIGKCLECGKETTNPRFCSKSCAVRFNNRAKPKRQPEGQCGKCGRPVPTRRAFCPECETMLAAQAAVQEERRAKNIQSWRSPMGELVEAPVMRLHVQPTVIFRPVEGELDKLPLTAPSGLLLDRLIGIALGGSPYIRPDEAPRYASLLYDLAGFVPSGMYGHGRSVRDLPLDSLPKALLEWITRFFGKEHHPLMATFALEAAQFVNCHALGYHFARSPAEIPPMTEVPRFGSFMGELNKSFKRDMTMKNIGHVTVLVQVPEGGTVVHRRDSHQVLHPGDRFFVRIRRGYLSESILDAPLLEANESQLPTYDIAEGFELYGELLLKPDLPQPLPKSWSEIVADKPEMCWQSIECQLSIPVRWITHAVSRDSTGGDNVTLLPIPAWR